jgi:transcription initiation factor TFIID subunit 2
MAGAAEIGGDAAAAAGQHSPFVVQHQDVALDFDFAAQTITGRATLTIEPRTKELREIRLSARQMDVTGVRVDGKHRIEGFRYADPYENVVPLPRYSVKQHHHMARRVADGRGNSGAELVVPLPPSFRVQQMSGIVLSMRADSKPIVLDGADDEGGQRFKTFALTIEYVVRQQREGVHWVGCGDAGDLRYPHVYSYADSLAHAPASSWFPCVEGAGVRHTWRFSIKCPRTLGDLEFLATKDATAEPDPNGPNGRRDSATGRGGFSDEEKEMDLIVVCSGFLEDNDAPDDDKAHSRKWVFNCQTPVLSRHVGFAIGPFEEVDLAEFRDRDQDDKMGQSAVSICGLCLPGRSDEVRNTCMPVASVSRLVDHGLD